MKHFHTFDALRFFAFFIVFMHHLPENSNTHLSFFMYSGGIGVQIFFILSGFLISTLLFNEKQKTGKLNPKNFLIRRILRIWPLYYAMIIFAMLTPFILRCFSLDDSGIGYEPNWIFPLLFLENYQMMIHDGFSNVSPLRVMWSLCIEEHFYILWIFVFLMISNLKMPVFLTASIVLSFVFRVIYSVNDILAIDINTNIHYFSFGGLLAWILIFKANWIEKLNVIPLFLKSIIAVIIIISYFGIPHVGLDKVIIESLLVCMLTIVMIAMTLTSQNPLKINDSNPISRLGKYTYGMYLFHTIWINLFVRLMDNYILITISSLAATIISSIGSYYLFENQFLKMKKYFR